MQLNTLSMVHEFLRRSVKPGDFCIDATAGKGRDTALLCRLTGDAGRVLAFDIQEAAVAQTKALLAAEGLTAEVIRDSHANMERYAVAETVDCVVFNFGRLPGPLQVNTSLLLKCLYNWHITWVCQRINISNSKHNL